MTQKINEVAPPGWGHTKAEKEKTKPNKPKSKIGGTAHEFQKDLDSGKFKGLPGDKTYKDKKASMFKLMWSMKNKGDKPHYKPGVKNKLKAKYKEKNEMIDPKKIRNYKNVSNATVEKANKEAEKVKDKEQKGTLQFPEMPQENLSLAPKGKGKKAAKALYKEETFVERILELDYKEFGFETQKDLIEYATQFYAGNEDSLDEWTGTDAVVAGAVLGGLSKARKSMTVAGRLAKQQKKLSKLKDKQALKDTKREIKTMKKGPPKSTKEAADTWHPDPAKDRLSTSMKHTAKSVAHHDAQKKKPTVDSRAMASKLQDILKKQRERNAANKEEVEIDELSKKTLGSYVKKAVPSHSIHQAAQVRRVADKRKKGINTAVDKLSKEEVEDAYDYKAKKGAVAAPGSGSIAKPRKAKASDANKSIEQQIKDAMKEKFDRDPTRATVSSKTHTTRTGAGAERKRVGPERKIKWGKGGATGSKETKKRGRHDYEGDVDYVAAKTAPTLGKGKPIPTKKGRGLPKSRREFSNSGEYRDTLWNEEGSLIDAAMRELSKKK